MRLLTTFFIESEKNRVFYYVVLDRTILLYRYIYAQRSYPFLG